MLVRRRARGNVFEKDARGEGLERSMSEDSSSSACSGIFGSIFSPLHDGPVGYGSSMVVLSGLLLLPECNGEDGLRMVAYGLMYRPEESTPGEEWARCIGGTLAAAPDKTCLILLGGD